MSLLAHRQVPLLIQRLPLLGLCALGIGLAACNKAPSQGAAKAAPPPAVEVVRISKQPVSQQIGFVGRVAAVDRVELRARVEGFLKARNYSEGEMVSADAMLFEIEPDRYQAVLDQRQADLTKAEAELANAKAQHARGEELLAMKNMSAAEVDKLRAAELVAQGSVAQAKAAVDAAQLDLGYTTIKAPVAGRVGRAALSVGNLVSPSTGVLATLVSQDPIYVLFPVTQKEFLAAKEQHKADEKNAEMSAEVKLPNGKRYQHKGELDFVDITTDTSTDTLTVRARFANPEGLLIDGQYVSVYLEAKEQQEALLVPQAALQIDQQGHSVFIVDDKKQAQVRRIKVGANQGANAIVLEGLNEGDLVITEGLQKVQPGKEVIASPAESAVTGEVPVKTDASTQTATQAASGEASK